MNVILISELLLQKGEIYLRQIRGLFNVSLVEIYHCRNWEVVLTMNLEHNLGLDLEVPAQLHWARCIMEGYPSYLINTVTFQSQEKAEKRGKWRKRREESTDKWTQ